MRVYEKLHEKNGGKEMAKDKQCSVEGCTNPHKSRGFCNKHYLQALSRGEIQTKRKSWNSKKKEAEVIPTKAGIQRKKELDSPIKSGNDNPGNNGKYIIAVDFSRYPKLHERLMRLAEQEFRTPEFQLMHMLNQEFQQMEERA
jgi:hypothetical protein